jgi:hypothetical protein
MLAPLMAPTGQNSRRTRSARIGAGATRLSGRASEFAGPEDLEALQEILHTVVLNR